MFGGSKKKKNNKKKKDLGFDQGPLPPPSGPPPVPNETLFPPKPVFTLPAGYVSQQNLPQRGQPSDPYSGNQPFMPQQRTPQRQAPPPPQKTPKRKPPPQPQRMVSPQRKQSEGNFGFKRQASAKGNYGYQRKDSSHGKVGYQRKDSYRKTSQGNYGFKRQGSSHGNNGFQRKNSQKKTSHGNFGPKSNKPVYLPRSNSGVANNYTKPSAFAAPANSFSVLPAGAGGDRFTKQSLFSNKSGENERRKMGKKRSEAFVPRSPQKNSFLQAQGQSQTKLPRMNERNNKGGLPSKSRRKKKKRKSRNKKLTKFSHNELKAPAPPQRTAPSPKVNAPPIPPRKQPQRGRAVSIDTDGGFFGTASFPPPLKSLDIRKYTKNTPMGGRGPPTLPVRRQQAKMRSVTLQRKVQNQFGSTQKAPALPPRPRNKSPVRNPGPPQPTPLMGNQGSFQNRFYL